MDPLPAMCVPLLHRGQVGLQDACKILNIHCDVIALLRRQAVLLRQLLKDLRQMFH